MNCAICGHCMPVSAMNPYPCGYFGNTIKPCTCSSAMVTRYQKRTSGPLMDRIDIHVEVPRLDYEKLSDDRFGESSDIVQIRVEAARDAQRHRFEEDELTCNADMYPQEIRLYCHLAETGDSLIISAMSQLQLTIRAYQSVLKLSRTIADLAGDEKITPPPSCRSAAGSTQYIDVRIWIDYLVFVIILYKCCESMGNLC